jgi:hypothetical protein
LSELIPQNAISNNRGNKENEEIINQLRNDLEHREQEV